MIENFEEKMAAPDFWDDNEKAQALIAEMNAVKSSVDQYQKLQADYDDAVVMIELESSNSPEKNIKVEATKYTGGLLDWVTLQLGKSISSPTGTVRELTDNNMTTYKIITNGDFVWYSFTSPVEISAVIAKYTSPVTVEFYDINNNLLQRYDLLSSDGVQVLPAPVQDVSTVVLKSTGSSSRVYEWNVFAVPLTAPLPTTITWIQGGDQVAKLEWTANGAESYNVKRATSLGGPYTVIANTRGTLYSDNTVTNEVSYIIYSLFSFIFDSFL